VGENEQKVVENEQKVGENEHFGHFFFLDE
jgi:hypothetical protein